MSDGRFFSLLIGVFAIAVLGLLLLFNWAQKPEGLDRQLITTLLGFLSAPVAVLLNNMANSAQFKKLQQGQEDIKKNV